MITHCAFRCPNSGIAFMVPMGHHLLEPGRVLHDPGLCDALGIEVKKLYTTLIHLPGSFPPPMDGLAVSDAPRNNCLEVIGRVDHIAISLNRHNNKELQDRYLRLKASDFGWPEEFLVTDEKWILNLYGEKPDGE